MAKFFTKMVSGIEKFIKSVEDKLDLTFADEMHVVISFLLAWAIRGSLLENAFAIIPLVAIFVLKEVYDSKKENATGFSGSDLRWDAVGGVLGYFVGILCSMF